MQMFYDLVNRNSKQNRKENGLFFVSLIMAIVAFYIILSLEKQDVIIFLKTMESEALDKLFLLIPALYGLSLFILFFLVYFAGKYQLDRRSKELGMYLDPPVGKSGVNHRLRKLGEMAEKLREQGTET